MTPAVVTRITALARLADVDEALERARNAIGDTEWEDFESDVTAGEILPLVLEVSATACDRNGQEFTVGCVNEDVWVAARTHPPELEEAVREISSKDFGHLSSGLRGRGVDVSSDGLGGMYVAVTLDESLRRAVLEIPATAAQTATESY
jgi:hypothetical protein